MKVLYVNHTSRISGGERSLLDLLGGLPDVVSPVVACPPGPLAESVRGLGVQWRRLPAIEASLRLHPLHTPAGLAALATAGVVVRQLAGRVAPDLVHGNSVRSGLIVSLAARLGAPPAIAHVRDCLPPGRASSLTLRAVARGASEVLANSEYTRACVMRALAPRQASVRVVYSPVDTARFDPDRFEPSEARARLNLPQTAPVLAVVAQITPWKGQDDAVRVLAHVKRKRPNVRLLLVGSATFIGRATRYDNQAYVRRLHALIESEGVRGDVILLGARDDVPALLRAVDLLLVPSWEEPFGRTVVEAMAMKVPVVATSRGGPAEIVREGVDGLLLEPRRPERWAEAIESLLDDPGRLARMGESGRARALDRFSLSAHVDAVLAAYRNVAARAGGVAEDAQARALSL
ncbi:MAG: glycosyltransferase family 4 protein [Actinomycetota bacterium]|nr:glycosyltransferase family 4 protein [Actinomycetota bacterium]